jgi:hypothetical protein
MELHVMQGLLNVQLLLKALSDSQVAEDVSCITKWKNGKWQREKDLFPKI